jgi:hypothetical protein
MAEKRLWSAREHGRVIAPAGMEGELPDRVDARMDGNQASLLHPPVDRLTVQPAVAQLGGRNDAVLGRGTKRDPLVGRELVGPRRRSRAIRFSICVSEKAHGPMVALLESHGGDECDDSAGGARAGGARAYSYTTSSGSGRRRSTWRGRIRLRSSS